MKQLGRLFSVLVFVAGIAGIIYPAFIEGGVGPGGVRLPPPSITQAIISIFIQPTFSLVWFFRLISLVAAMAGGYILFVNRYYRNVPITAIRTKITYDFKDNCGTTTTYREQTLRANQPNVTAYFSGIKSTAPGGTIPLSRISLNATCSGELLPSTLDHYGTEKGYDIIHGFGRELPFSVLMPLVPRIFLSGEEDRIFGWFKSYLIFRTQTSAYLNEFNGPSPQLKFVSSNYPQHNVTIALNFYGPIPGNLKIRRCKNNGILSVHPKPLADGTGVVIFVKRLENETLIITWDGVTSS